MIYAINTLMLLVLLVIISMLVYAFIDLFRKRTELSRETFRDTIIELIGSIAFMGINYYIAWFNAPYSGFIVLTAIVVEWFMIRNKYSYVKWQT